MRGARRRRHCLTENCASAGENAEGEGKNLRFHGVTIHRPAQISVKGV
jgi:hypothetical protein